jgi:hypothetical protein
MKTYKILDEKSKEINGVYRMAGRVRDIINSSKITENRRGYNYNGYGYTDWTITYVIANSGARKLKKLLKEKENVPKKKVLTDEEVKEKWCQRLAKLTDIDIEEARELADEKLNYKIKQINNLVWRQDNDRMSKKREQIINKIKRSNPLRYIRDEEHAYNIINASNRHNYTDYEDKLEEGRELAEQGEIEYDEVREYARRNCR